MKKILTLLLVFCMKGTFAQILDLCPCGIMLSFSADKFNFHKPKKNCLIDFGICIKNVKVSLSCAPCDGPKPSARLDGNIVTGYVSAVCGNLELHLPGTLIEDEMYKDQNTDFFEIEDGAIPLSIDGAENSPVIRGGIYPVSRINDELVIPLNFY